MDECRREIGQRIGEKWTSVGEKSASVGEKWTSVGEKSASVGEKWTSVGEKSASVGEKSGRIGEKSASVDEFVLFGHRSCGQGYGRAYRTVPPPCLKGVLGLSLAKFCR